MRQTTDRTVWDALTAATRRTDPGVRVELLDFQELPEGRAGRRLHLGYLAAFLDDESQRGPSNVEWMSRIQVRNYAAYRIGHLLKLGPKPDADWKPEDWARLRAEVRTARSAG